MKKAILPILILCFAVFSASAQVENNKPKAAAQKSAVKTNQNNPQANNPNAPVITFDKMVHDYGTMALNADGKCEFKFTNEGKEPLILTNVRATWGCTIPAWPRKPVLPGESDVIVVKYNTKKVGTINKSITVYSNAKQSTIRLKVKGKVEAASASVLPEKKLNNNGAPVNK